MDGWVASTYLEEELAEELALELTLVEEAALAVVLGLAKTLEPTGGRRLRAPTARSQVIRS